MRNFLVLQFSEHVEEAVYSVGGESLGGREALDRIISPVEERVTVDQEQLFFTHWCLKNKKEPVLFYRWLVSGISQRKGREIYK